MTVFVATSLYDVGMELDTHELAWAAGFFDGEGCVGMQRKTRWSVWANEERHDFWPIIGMPQTDVRPLERFQKAVLGVGHIYGPQILKNPNHNPRWTYQCRSYEATQAVVAMLWRFLSPIKQEQALRVLAEARVHFQNPPPTPARPPKTHCKYGHPYDEANTYVMANGRRNCKKCVARNGRIYYRRKKERDALAQASNV